jgi:FAD-dependent monooxygenase
MNMGIGDAYDLRWKLAAAMQYGGRGLLESYTSERRSVALCNVDHSVVHMKVHSDVAQFFEGGDSHRVDWPTKEGEALRRRLHEHYQEHDGEKKDFGVEMGYNYDSFGLQKLQLRFRYLSDTLICGMRSMRIACENVTSF